MNEGMLEALRPVHMYFLSASPASLPFVRVLGSGGGDGVGVIWQDPRELI